MNNLRKAAVSLANLISLKFYLSISLWIDYQLKLSAPDKQKCKQAKLINIQTSGEVASLWYQAKSSHTIICSLFVFMVLGD